MDAEALSQDRKVVPLIDDARPKGLVASASAQLLQLLSFYRFFVAVTVSSWPSHPDIVIFRYHDMKFLGRYAIRNSASLRVFGRFENGAHRESYLF
jgi:hypothetical protein